MLQFIKHYVPFEKRQNFDKFGKEIDTFTNKSKDMGITELVRNYELGRAEEEGVEKGVKKGEDIGIEKSLAIIKMVKAEKDTKVIAQELNVKLEVVEKIKKEMGY
ncbi:MAG: hypothetical protein AAF573_20960 [Bacteroidota bacterium]